MSGDMRAGRETSLAYPTPISGADAVNFPAAVEVPTAIRIAIANGWSRPAWTATYTVWAADPIRGALLTSVTGAALRIRYGTRAAPAPAARAGVPASGSDAERVERAAAPRARGAVAARSGRTTHALLGLDADRTPDVARARERTPHGVPARLGARGGGGARGAARVGEGPALEAAVVLVARAVVTSERGVSAAELGRPRSLGRLARAGVGRASAPSGVDAVAARRERARVATDAATARHAPVAAGRGGGRAPERVRGGEWRE